MLFGCWLSSQVVFSPYGVLLKKSLSLCLWAAIKLTTNNCQKKRYGFIAHIKVSPKVLLCYLTPILVDISLAPLSPINKTYPFLLREALFVLARHTTTQATFHTRLALLPPHRYEFSILYIRMPKRYDAWVGSKVGLGQVASPNMTHEHFNPNLIRTH